MNSGIYLASKACLLICILGFYAGVSGLGCPPDDKNLQAFQFSACAIFVGAPSSFPGAPNLDGNFNCRDKKVKTPLCCKKPTQKSAPAATKPNTKTECTTTVSPRIKLGGSTKKRNT